MGLRWPEVFQDHLLLSVALIPSPTPPLLLMAEGIGVVIGVASLILQLGTLYKNKSVSLRYLEEDLESFHEFLRLPEHDLPRQHPVRKSCEGLVADIEVLARKNARRSSWRRNVALSSSELQELRERLNTQIMMLGQMR